MCQVDRFVWIVFFGIAIASADGCAGGGDTTEVDGNKIADSHRTSARECFTITEISEGLPTTRGWRTNPSFGDVDGDGDLDFAATTRKGDNPSVFLYDKSSGWSSRAFDLGHFPCGIGVELADLTGDAVLDLLIADHCTGLHLFRGDGAGGWESLGNLRHHTGEGFNDAASGDVNGDGLVDILAVAAFTTGYTLYLQDESGRFTPVRTDLPVSGYGYDVHLHDLDGDGRLDIYGTLQGLKPSAKARGAREAKVFLQKETGWQPGVGLPESGNFYGMARGDINSDGLVDLVMSNRDFEGGIQIYEGIGPGEWTESPHAFPGRIPGQERARPFAGVQLADLNGDGHLDLLSVESRKPAVAFWLGDGTGRFAECPDQAGPVSKSAVPGWGIAVGDIDGDGSLEIVSGFGSEQGGVLKAWSLGWRSR